MLYLILMMFFDHSNFTKNQMINIRKNFIKILVQRTKLITVPKYKLYHMCNEYHINLAKMRTILGLYDYIGTPLKYTLITYLAVAMVLGKTYGNCYDSSTDGIDGEKCLYPYFNTIDEFCSSERWYELAKNLTDDEKLCMYVHNNFNAYDVKHNPLYAQVYQQIIDKGLVEMYENFSKTHSLI